MMNGQQFVNKHRLGVIASNALWNIHGGPLDTVTVEGLAAKASLDRLTGMHGVGRHTVKVLREAFRAEGVELPGVVNFNQKKVRRQRETPRPPSSCSFCHEAREAYWVADDLVTTICLICSLAATETLRP